MAALDTIGSSPAGRIPLLIAESAREAEALALALASAWALWLPARRLLPRLAAALATLPALFAASYMRFHDVKYDVLGPFPQWWLVTGCRLLIAALALAVASGLARAAAAAPKLARAATLALLLGAPPVSAYLARPGLAGNPALLLLTIDTLRADHLGCYGNPLVLTPVLDRLSRQGRLFERAFCQIPITTPSHASILTGLYPPAHAVRGQAYSMSPLVPTVTEALSARGLATAAFIGAFPLDSKFGLHRGFQVYDDEFQGGAGLRELSLVRFALLFGPTPEIERTAGQVNERVASWLRIHGSETYFLWVHYFDPHGPYTPAEPWRTLYEDRLAEALPAERATDEAARRALADVLPHEATDDLRAARLAYAAEVAATDGAAGLLLAHVERGRNGRDDVTTVVLADHGESLTEHGAYFRHGEDLYEPSLQIPMLVASPTVAPALVSELAETIDVAPILAGAAGVPWPRSERHAAIFAESTSAAVHYTPRKVLCVRTAGAKLIQGAADDRRELYDLDSDPDERDDLALRRPDLSGALEPLLDAYRAGATGERPPAAIDRETIEKLRALGYLR